MRFLYRYGLLLPVAAVLLTLFFFSVAYSEESLDPDSYRQECENGKTIYCIAAGMEEQKTGNSETALKYFQSACESHLHRGHLRACTPLLSLARQLDRLDEASAELEKLCEGGDDVICFYLAKEYFKITEFDRGFVHLERLCRDDFQSPDKADYGPCYHLGDNLKTIGQMKRALKIFNFDCDRDSLSAKPSCDQAEAIRLLVRQGKANGVKIVRGFKMIETLAFAVVMIPLSGLLLLRNGRKFALTLLRIPVPALTFICGALWESHARQEFILRADLFFIIPAVVLTLVIAYTGHRRLQSL
jgi:tetratricopeptide (TPR) repeat protein